MEFERFGHSDKDIQQQAARGSKGGLTQTENNVTPLSTHLPNIN